MFGGKVSRTNGEDIVLYWVLEQAQQHSHSPVTVADLSGCAESANKHDIISKLLISKVLGI